MSKIRYYTDEHVSRAVIRGLRMRGIDVVSVPEANRLGASDEEHLAFAWPQRVSPMQVSTGESIRGLMLIYQILEAEDMGGRVEYL